jgi:hypothetical protein
MEFSKTVNWQTHTDGTSMWAEGLVRTVQILEVDLRNCNDEQDFGELCARFNTRDWDSQKDGLIYTDRRWIEEFRALMRTLGFSPRAVEDINYSEQGMQGYNYVSMDVGPDFLREVEPMYRWLINREAVNA